MIAQLTSLKVFQCTMPMTSWVKVLSSNSSLKELVIENSDGLEELKQKTLLPNFAASILENGPLSKLEIFDYSCSLVKETNDSRVLHNATFAAFLKLVRLGTIQQFYLRDFSNHSSIALPADSSQEEYEMVNRGRRKRRFLSDFSWQRT